MTIEEIEETIRVALEPYLFEVYTIEHKSQMESSVEYALGFHVDINIDPGTGAISYAIPPNYTDLIVET